jgi:hypothetical protein
MMTFPTEWKNKSHVPNHQPVAHLVKICQNVAKKKANPAGVLGGQHEKTIIYTSSRGLISPQLG